MKILKIKNGFITILSIAMVGSLGLAVVLVVSMFSIGSVRSVKSIYSSYQAKNLADACAEIALQELRNSPSFSGSANLNLWGGNCNYQINDPVNSLREIRTVGEVNNYNKKIKILIDQIDPKINIISWLSVEDF